MNIYELVTSQILERIEETEKTKEPFYWIRPWTGGAKTPQNYITQIPYHGANLVTLTPGEYITYKQLLDYKKTLSPTEEKKVYIKKGCHTVPIFFFTKKPKKDKDGNIIYKKDKTTPEEVFVFKYYRAFNREDIKGLPSHFPAEHIEHTETESMRQADRFILAYAKQEKLTLDTVKDGSECFYLPGEHFVRVPAREGFTTAYDFYSSIFHELMHSTSKGLGRDMGKSFGSAAYCKEELVAQIGSAMLLNAFGIVPETKKIQDNDIAYIKGWAEHLKNNKSEIVRASSLAENAARYFFSTAQKQIQLEETLEITNPFISGR